MMGRLVRVLTVIEVVLMMPSEIAQAVVEIDYWGMWNTAPLHRNRDADRQ